RIHTENISRVSNTRQIILSAKILRMNDSQYSTQDLSKLTVIPVSTIRKWIIAGYLQPDVRAHGRGDVVLFGEDAEPQIRALALLTREFGDGALTREIIAEAMPKIRHGSRAITVSATLSLA